MKAKLLFSALCATVVLLTSGCVSNLSNITPQNVPQNSSGIYTLSCTAKVTETADLVKGSVKCAVVIDGTERVMTRSSFKKDLYTYDYVIPAGQAGAKYFYVLTYDVKQRGIVTHREKKSALQVLNLANRYVINLDAERGVVGAKVPVYGRGFSNADTILVGGIEAPTHFVSQNVVVFTVPAIGANEDYYVELHTAAGNLPVGKFHVDPAVLTVTPGEVSLAAGQKGMLVFSIPFDAPRGGLPVQILTNVPASVVMPEVIVPEGQRSVSVTVQGGQAGSGVLNISAPGFNPLQIPVNVQ